MAMQREFFEETGLLTPFEDWNLMVTVAGTNKQTGNTWEMDVYFYFSRLSMLYMRKLVYMMVQLKNGLRLKMF